MAFSNMTAPAPGVSIKDNMNDLDFAYYSTPEEVKASGSKTKGPRKMIPGGFYDCRLELVPEVDGTFWRGATYISPSGEIKTYWEAQVKIHIQNDSNFGGRYYYDRLTTRVWRNGHCLAADYLKAAGLGARIQEVVDASGTEGFKALVEQAILENTEVRVFVDWRAAVQRPDGSWEDLADTYEKFPESPEGGKQEVLKDLVSGRDIKAKYKTRGFYAKRQE